MAEIKGFIFDLDGVITDTAEYHYLGWQKLADEEGLAFDREFNEKFRGVSRMECLDLLLEANDKKATPEERKELAERKNNYYREYLKSITEDNLLDGIEDILKRVKEKGYKMAIASASKNTKIVVNKLDIKDMFDTISDGYSVKNSKPAPDLFLHTAEKLNLKPEECLVFEDAEAGIDAALAANMTAVGIGPETRVGHAHYRFDTVKEIDLDKILNSK
ncbi:MAG TPA: beta-phosphoglucomutase [Halanaerobiales bacterium]|nr:beta-phosphoglucomutase [Halanaerobiales bacterium]